MRSDRNVSTQVGLFLVVGVAVTALAWLLSPHLFTSLPARIAVAVGSVGAVAALFFIMYHDRRRQQRQLLNCVDLICGNEDIDSRHAAIYNMLQRNDPWWSEPMRRVQDRLQQNRDQIDETQHVRASAEVRARRLAIERDQMSAIVASLADPVIAIDQYGELLLANQSAQNILGIEEAAEDRAIDGLVQCEKLVDLLNATRQRKLPAHRSGEIKLLTSAGESRCYRVMCTGLAVADEAQAETVHSHGAVAVLNDVSHEKAIQKRNADFVSSVSHEMKTPLAAIKAYVELLADGEADDDETRDEFLAVINGQADRLHRLIDNLLNISRIEAGVVEVNKQARPLHELLEEAIEVVQPSAESKHIGLHCEFSPMYLTVLADRDMLLQAAINLLSNAIKYTPDGGTVILRSKMQDDQVVFEIEDSGVGLSEADREHVFKKFYRVKKDRQMASGTGLGLPLAKHIVEDVHGGKLTAESTLGQGSTFRITLPSARSAVGQLQFQ